MYTYTFRQALLNNFIEAHKCATEDEEDICGVHLVYLTFRCDNKARVERCDKA